MGCQTGVNRETQKDLYGTTEDVNPKMCTRKKDFVRTIKDY